MELRAEVPLVIDLEEAVSLGDRLGVVGAVGDRGLRGVDADDVLDHGSRCDRLATFGHGLGNGHVRERLAVRVILGRLGELLGDDVLIDRQSVVGHLRSHLTQKGEDGRR